MASCIIPSQLDAYRKAWKEKDLDMRKLIKMSTEDRTALFSKYAGEDANKMNALFEEKLVLKNKVAGLKNFYNKTAEEGNYSQEKKDEIAKKISDYRAKQQERIFNPKEHEAFLSDLVKEEVGTTLTRDQSKTLWDLSVKSEELFKNYDSTKETWKSEKDGKEYGASKIAYLRYIENVKNGNSSPVEMAKEWGGEVSDLWKEDKFKAVGKVISDSVKNTTDTLINAVASWDNSFMGRQGGITLIKSPKTWWNMASESIKDVYKTFKGEDPRDVLMADIYADPDYINGNYEKAKLNFGVEEEIPTKLLEKIWVVGKLFKASDVAFIDSAIRARRGLFKIMKETNLKNKIELSDEVLSDMGTIVNAITARGKVGQIGTSRLVKVLMWAPRMLKADWDVLTAHTFGLGLETNQARKQAAVTVAQVVLTTAAIAAMAKAMGADVETDPRSSDFLKIKIGNTRINAPFVRGMPQIVTLMARIKTLEKKNAMGIIKKLNDGSAMGQNIFEVGTDFLANKTTPPVSAVLTWAKGRTFSGDKPSAGATAAGFIPISVQNFIGLKDDHSTQAVVGAFIDLFGISSNTYSSTDVNWTDSEGKELKQFRDTIGEAEFSKANKDFNAALSSRLSEIKSNKEFTALSDEDKQKLITKEKGKIKDQIFRDYSFHYKKERSNRLPKI